MTKDDVKAAVVEALKEHHPCIFDEEDRGILRDVIKAGKKLKESSITLLVAVIILAVAVLVIFFGGKISVAG